MLRGPNGRPAFFLEDTVIKRLSLGHFKGLSLAEEYGKLTIFTGPCGSGKSSRLQAIQWAITGTTGSDTGGNKATSAAKWCPGSDMWAVVEANDLIARRAISIDDEGKVSGSLSVRGPGIARNGKEGDYLLGDKLGRFMPMWRLSEFTSLSPELRRQMVLQLCSQAVKGPTAKDIIERIRGAIVEQPIEWRFIEDHLRFVSSSMPAADAIAEMTAALKTAISSAKSAADGADNASRSLADRREELGMLSGTVCQARADMAARDLQLQEVLKQRANQEGRTTARAELQRMLVENGEEQERLDEQAAELKAEDVEAMAARALAMEQEAEDAEKSNTAQNPGEPPVDLDACERAQRANEEQATTARIVGAIEGQIDRVQVQLEGLEASDWTKALNLGREIQGEYKSRGEFSATCEDLVSLCMDNAKPEQAETLRAALANHKKLLKSAKFDADQATKAVARAIIDRNAAVAQMAAYRKALSAWDTARCTALDHCSRLRREAGEIRETLDKRADRIARLAEQQADCETARVDLERRLNELDAAGGVISEDELNRQEAALRDQLAACERTITALIKASTIDAEMKASAVRAEKAKRELATAKAAMDALRDIREKLMYAMVSPLIDHIGVFLKAAGRQEEPYIQLETASGAAAFEMGWRNGRTEISMDAMSGGERVLWGAALAYALTMLANPPLKVLLIEAAEVDVEIFNGLTGALKAVSADLDNVFLATCQYVPPVDGWRVIQTPTAETAAMPQKG